MWVIADLANYQFEAGSLPYFICAITVIALGTYVFLRKKEYKVNLTFFIFSISAFLWLFGYGMIYLSTWGIVAIFWAKVVYLGIILLPANGYTLSVMYLGLKQQREPIWLSYIVSFIFVILLMLTDYLVGSLHKYHGGYSVKGNLFFSSLFLFVFLILAAVTVVNYYVGSKRTESRAEKKRIKILFLCYLTGYIATLDFLAVYNINYYPLSYLLFVIFTFSYVWVVMKHKLYIVEPVKEEVKGLKAGVKPKLKQKYMLETGYSYLIEEETKDQVGLNVFTQQVLIGKNGLYITRKNPDIVRRNTKLKKTPIIWLTEEEGENNIKPAKLEEISYAITNFVDKAENSIVLLDGLSYLINHTSFNGVLNLIQNLKDHISLKKSHLLVVVNPIALQKDQLQLLKNELEPLKSNE